MIKPNYINIAQEKYDIGGMIENIIVMIFQIQWVSPKYSISMYYAFNKQCKNMSHFLTNPKSTNIRIHNVILLVASQKWTSFKKKKYLFKNALNFSLVCHKRVF